VGQYASPTKLAWTGSLWMMLCDFSWALRRVEGGLLCHQCSRRNRRFVTRVFDK
jgi:hypothetical protein